MCAGPLGMVLVAGKVPYSFHELRSCGHHLLHILNVHVTNRSIVQPCVFYSDGFVCFLDPC